MDVRYPNLEPQRGLMLITMYAMHGKQWMSVTPNPEPQRG